MKYIIILLIICTLGYGSYVFLYRANESQIMVEPENPDNVVAYISKNISNLSPEKETVGGTFYVTNITLDGGFGTVDYEDGHNAYSANFSYSFSEKGEVFIKNFVLID